MADRNYGSSFNQPKAAPAFCYIWDDTLNSGSGMWRPQNADDGGGSGGSGSTDMGPTILAIGSGVAYEAPASKAFSSALSNRLLAKSGAGTLFGMNGYNNYTGQQYVHIYDNVNSGSNLISTFLVDGSDNFSIDFGMKGISMASGIFVCNSLTPVSLTNGGNDLFITVSYK